MSFIDIGRDISAYFAHREGLLLIGISRALMASANNFAGPCGGGEVKISRTCHALEPPSFDTPFYSPSIDIGRDISANFAMPWLGRCHIFCISCSTKLRADSLIHTRASGEVEITRELGGGGNPLGLALFDITLGRYWAGYLAISWLYCG